MIAKQRRIGRMASSVRVLIASSMLAILLAATASPAAADHDKNDGIDPATGMYVSVQFLFLFDWEEPWQNVREETISTPDESDQFVLANGTAKFTALAFANKGTPEQVREQVIEIYSGSNENTEIVAEDIQEIEQGGESREVPFATVSYVGVPYGETDAVAMRSYLELQQVSLADGTEGDYHLLLTLDAPEDEFADAWESANELITSDPLGVLGTPLFHGAAETGGDNAADDDDRNQDDQDDSRGDDDDGKTDGDGYSSPTYGYTLAVDPDEWEISDESSEDEVDVVELTNGTSVVRLTGSTFARNPQRCIDAAVDELLEDPDYEEFTQATNADEEPYEGDGPLGPFIGYTDGENLVYMECTDVAGGDAVLLIHFFVTIDDFSAELDAVDALLAELELEPSAQEQDDEPADDSDEPADDDNANAGNDDDADDDDADRGSSNANSYEDAAFDWNVEWNDDWSVVGDPEEDGFLTLSNGDLASTVQFVPIEDYNGDANRCVRDQLAALTDGDGISGVTAYRFDGESVKGGDEAAAYAAYRYSFKTGGTTIKMVQYFDCRTLVEGESVLLTVQIVSQDEYANQVEPFQELLAGLSVPGPEPAADDAEEEEAA